MSISHTPLFVMFLLAAGIPAATASPQAPGDIPTAGEIRDLVANTTDSEGQLPDNVTRVSSFSSSDIVINEVELNPRGNDVGKEWIELYNPADSDANISDFTIRTSKSLVIELPPSAEVKAGETYVIELDRQMLSNIAESLILSNATGGTVDRTPSLVDRSDDGRTWQRMPDGNNEWQFAPSTKEKLNDPDTRASSNRGSARSAERGSNGCLGSAGCAEGMVVRIVDGDTLYVSVNNTTYKVNLALVNAPSRGQDGFTESTAFTRNMCLGNKVLVDQDDEQLASNSNVVAVVYCSSENLNSELLDNGYATLDSDQCNTSEFARQSWAREHGC